MEIEGGGHLGPDGEGTVEALLGAVREILTDVGRGGDAEEVTLDACLDGELGLDSLSVAELLVRTEELFGVELPDATLATARTPADLLSAVAGATGVAPARRDIAPRTPTGAEPGGGPDTGRARAGATVEPGGGGGLLAALYGIWVLGVFAAACAVVGPLLVVVPSLRLRWQLVRRAGRLLGALAGVRVRVRGAEHLPRDRPIVLVANHASHLDPLVLLRLLEEPAVFAAVAELADNPLLRLGLQRMGVQLVGRGDRVRGVADARALTDTVRDGRSVVLFPEGRRVPTDGLEPFRMGAFLVAARTGAPLVPVALRGTRTVLPVGRLLPRRAEVVLTVAPPITTDERGWAGAVTLQREAREQLLRHGLEADLT